MSNLQIGLRTLALVALVVFSTAVLVQPELIGGSAPATALAIGSIPVVGHH
ncbi:hypothetical protein [Massilia sp. X63]|jgi:hypothetical protein|uniref:hypothetical protein n=1 Tax=Massilia sp. X63 TaxID=3237285 RepID=UPI0034DCCE9A